MSKNHISILICNHIDSAFITTRPDGTTRLSWELNFSERPKTSSSHNPNSYQSNFHYEPDLTKVFGLTNESESDPDPDPHFALHDSCFWFEDPFCSII